MTDQASLNELNSNSSDLDQLCQDYMTHLYEGTSGFIQYQPNEKEENAKQKIFLTYGEILPASLSKILAYVDINNQDVFIDLGSGVGKVIAQVFLSTLAQGSYGIEASENRYTHSARVAEQIKKDLPDLFENGRELAFFNTNFIDTDISKATIIYTCATCFSDELLADIAKQIETCPNIRYILSLKQFENKLPLKETIEIECSWGTTSCYIYGL